MSLSNSLGLVYHLIFEVKTLYSECALEPFTCVVVNLTHELFVLHIGNGK